MMNVPDPKEDQQPNESSPKESRSPEWKFKKFNVGFEEDNELNIFDDSDGEGESYFYDTDEETGEEEESDESDEEGDEDKAKISNEFTFIRGSDIRSVCRLQNGAFAQSFQGSVFGKNRKYLTVVIKKFHVPLAIEKENNLKLTNLMGLKHRNIVPIYGAVIDNTNVMLEDPTGCPRIVLRYFPQGNLLKYLSQRTSPQDYAMLGKLALDIIQGCEYLHDKKIIHGNLAARNIIIQKSVSQHKTHFNAMVSDFGIAQLAVDTQEFSWEASKGHFQSLRIDPIRWMPKELVTQLPNRLNFTEHSDVWSFGIVLWEMWTKGEIPFDYMTQEDVKEALKEGKCPLDFYRPPGCPAHILNVMRKVFNANPESRPTFNDLNQDFTSFKMRCANQSKTKTKGGKRISADPVLVKKMNEKEEPQEKISIFEAKVRRNSTSPGTLPTPVESYHKLDAGKSNYHFATIDMKTQRYPSHPTANLNRQSASWYQTGSPTDYGFGNRQPGRFPYRSPSPRGHGPVNYGVYYYPTCSQSCYNPHHSTPSPSHNRGHVQVNYGCTAPIPSLSGSALDEEIRRRERELEILKTQRQLEQLVQKEQNEREWREIEKQLSDQCIDNPSSAAQPQGSNDEGSSKLARAGQKPAV